MTQKLFLIIFMLSYSVISNAFSPASLSAYGLPTSTYTGLSAGVGGAGAVSGAAPFAVGASAFGVGMALGYFGLDYILGDGDQGSIRFPLTSDPAKQIPAPLAPLTANTSIQWSLSFGPGSQAVADACTGGKLSPPPYTSPETACAAQLCYSISAGYVDATTSLSYSSPTAAVCSLTRSPSSTPILTDYAAILGCPSGYTHVSGICQLQDARIAVSDKACDLKRTGSALTMISDPDCAKSGQAIDAICSSGGTVCLGVGKRSNGQPLSFYYVSTANGGTSVTYSEQSVVSGQSQVTTTTVAVDGAGIVTAVTGGVSAGTINSITGAVETTTSPVLQPNVDLTPVTNAINAQRTADELRETNRLKKENDDRIIPPFSEAIPKEYIPVSISSVSFSSAAVCPAAIGFTMLGKVYSISYQPMCDLMTLLRPLFLALGAFGAAFIFIGGLKT